ISIYSLFSYILCYLFFVVFFFFFFQAEDGIRDDLVTGVQTCALPILLAFSAAPVAAALGTLLIGFFAVRLSSIYFAMLTLAFCQIAYAIVHQWYDVTGGDNGLLGIWPPQIGRASCRERVLAAGEGDA